MIIVTKRVKVFVDRVKHIKDRKNTGGLFFDK